MPWLALGFTPASGMLVYASWGQGVESEVVPNRSLYSNRGQTLPALKSRQTEAGFKFSDNDRDASFTLFDIERPAANDFCNAEGDACERRIDGIARHRGVELAAGWRVGSWGPAWQRPWLQARRQGSQDSSLNGQWPTNARSGAEVAAVARHHVAAEAGDRPCQRRPPCRAARQQHQAGQLDAHRRRAVMAVAHRRLRHSPSRRRRQPG
ncbi:MAG: TonB-dependent receptor [Rubrivivax sp.]|nr:TonB-dependent receptor [Rubrivivax sp.]